MFIVWVPGHRTGYEEDTVDLYIYYVYCDVGAPLMILFRGGNEHIVDFN